MPSFASFVRPGLILAVAALSLHIVADDAGQSPIAFDAGADLRIRQEIMENVPGLPGGGLMSTSVRGKTRNHMRFRPRVWGEVKGITENAGTWRIRTRLTDEFRWNVNYRNRSNEFPDEVILDNLFVEGTGIFDGFLDLCVGRQDFYGIFGLDRVISDGTPTDGSRTSYGDMARMALHFTERSKLDIFGLYDSDTCDIRFGSEASRWRRLTALDPSSEPEMDEWGAGLIWSSEIYAMLPYKLFAIEKGVTPWHDKNGVRHPDWARTTLGFNLKPQLTENFSLEFEGMSQVGKNGDGDGLCGWSAYVGTDWRNRERPTWRPFFVSGYRYMSGDEDTSSEDGGHSAWDPLWARAENESCLFQYGTLYGCGFWSNMHYWRNAAGFEIGPAHSVTFSTGPIFADRQDGLGGGDGYFKGELSQIWYAFPLTHLLGLDRLTSGDAPSRGLAVFGHLIFELFNPGDYYETRKPSWFVRWQIEFRF